MTDVEALVQIEKILAQLESDDQRKLVISWASKKHLGFADESPQTGHTRKRSKTEMHGKTASQKRKKGGRKPRLVDNLNLRPEDKMSFKEFVEKKKPTTNWEKGVLAVFYLSHELGLQDVTLDHVYTCFVEVGWRIPYDLANTLQVAASKWAWLVTADMDSIQITARGENLINLDLPRQAT